MQTQSNLKSEMQIDRDKLISYGRKILSAEKHDVWEKYVLSRDDEFLEIDAIAALGLLSDLNKGCDISLVAKKMNAQIYSGRAYSSVLSIVFLFSNRGTDLVNAISDISRERHVVSQR